MNKEKLTEKLLQIFRQAHKPLKLNEISKMLGYRSDSAEYQEFKSILLELCDKKIISKSSRRRYSLNSFESEIDIEGTLYIKNQRGIVKTNHPEFDDIHIKRRNLSTALHGDKVMVRLLGIKEGKKYRGVIIRIIKRSDDEITGTVDFDENFYFIVPDDQHHYLDFLIPKKGLNGAQHGDKVTARLIAWEDETKSPQARVVDIIGQAGKPDVEYESILHEFSLPTEFPTNVLKETKAFSPPKRKPPKRLDYRKKTVITIDPEDARDFDDALSLETLPNGNQLLGVHIADVSNYVTENSELDIEARTRATSVYLVDRVIPMLPEKLSNEICSLKPDEQRLTFSVLIEISDKAEIIKYEIAESIIKSSRRYSYEEVLEIIETGKGDNAKLIGKLHELAESLRQKRYKEGGIEFKTTEYKFKLDDNKFPVEVELKRTTKATSLVEECMLAANRVVANYIKQQSAEYGLALPLPYLYRVHENPDPKKLNEALNFIEYLGIRVNKKNITSNKINQLLRKFENKPEFDVINKILVRSMPKAEYSHHNIGHFGLGFDEYTHFTSPIRRYPDLIVHRLIKEYVKSNPDKDRRQFLNVLCKDVAKHSTQQERTSMEAERASVKLAQAVMAETYIGEEFNGLITGVMSFGIFVMVDELYIEGLLHIKDINDDYYFFEESKQMLKGKRKKREFGFGKRLRVKITRVNIEKRQIDLAYIADYPFE